MSWQPPPPPSLRSRVAWLSKEPLLLSLLLLGLAVRGAVTPTTFCSSQGSENDNKCQAYHRLNVARAFSTILVVLSGLYILAATAAEANRKFDWAALTTIAVAGACTRLPLRRSSRHCP